MKYKKQILKSTKKNDGMEIIIKPFLNVVASDFKGLKEFFFPNIKIADHHQGIYTALKHVLNSI